MASPSLYDTPLSSDASEKGVHMNQSSIIRQPHLSLSDNEADGDEEDDFAHGGDYSARMEELFDEVETEMPGDDEDDPEEGFVYTGIDAQEPSGGYGEQLRDVLGVELEDDDEREVERSLLRDDEQIGFQPEHLAHVTPSITASLPMTPHRVASPTGTPPKLSKPFVHPTVSRLRSYTPQHSRLSSNVSAGTFHPSAFDGMSPSPSHFSAISRTSSHSNLQTSIPGGSINGHANSERQVFRWTQLRNIGDDIYVKHASKAASVLGSVLGSATTGSPVVLAANGLICIGTDTGRIFVYDFKQTLKAVCGGHSSDSFVGAVTALALSHDHTFVASGHSSGYIQLFDLSNPQTPTRSVSPTSLAVVLTGRKEGHLRGSRIVSIGFVAGRHTALITADDHGLAFYHSLGKVLFVESPDILRILGKYPEQEPEGMAVRPSRTQLPNVSSKSNIRTPQNGLTPGRSARKRGPRYTILGMMPLPLGTSPHPTDVYHVVALLTPAKLVIVGLKPTPRTWFKCPRDNDEELKAKSRSRWRGTLAWFPSVLPSSAGATNRKGQLNGKTPAGTTPMLVYTWANSLHLIRVSELKVIQTARNVRTGKISEVEVGTIVFEEAGKWTAEEDILAVQWLNVNQVVVLTLSKLQVYDVSMSSLIESIQFDVTSLVSPAFGCSVNDALPYSESIGEVAHSVRVYKGKIFLLGRRELQVGTLLTWADLILAHVQEGDFLSAIDLARSYYVGDAPGNRNSLPDDLQLRQEVVGQKLRDLMVASAQYAFSEDRMTDGTHDTPDGRGVDRTSLFQGLVTTCARACVALDDLEFLFEDLFQRYDDAGISAIFLLQLEPFVLENEIRLVPPRITQRLVTMHADNNRPDLIEKVIWHIDPACLDINQAILLCQRHHLYDALIYVYTRAMRDYVSPVVDLLGLIRSVYRYRKTRKEEFEPSIDEPVVECIILNAYKIYPYLADVLSGLTYPSEEPLSEEEAFYAKKDIYTFLFFGRSSVWPLGDSGKLVLTSDEDGGVEPTYPYARLLLRFDAESFLHTLDIAFEDAYLNDETQGVSRLVIIRTLLDILSSSCLPSSVVTFVNIFIARNVPKYPQFIQMSPSQLHSILLALAEDSDWSTREDRQLAAEYLLSVYNPHESDRVLRLFRKAGFFRILRSWHRQERQWGSLLSTYLQDPDLPSSEIFGSISDLFELSMKVNKGLLPPELFEIIADALPQLLQVSVTSTAILLDKHMPKLHELALDAFGQNADHQRLLYLRHLLGPPRPEDEEYIYPMRGSRPSLNVTERLRQLYVSLQCHYHPSDVIVVLKFIPSELFNWSEVIQICEDKRVYDAVVWATNSRGDLRNALAKAETFERLLTLSIVKAMSDPSRISVQDAADIDRDVEALGALGRISVTICLEHSRGLPTAKVPLEDMWFQLLNSQISSVQSISGCCSPEALAGSKGQQDSMVDVQWRTISALRSLVQETFGALVSISSTRTLSFPTLFKRLVDQGSHSHTSAGTQYTEFRAILTGMLEAYRSEGDMLIITKHLVDRDLFETVEDITRERARGWTPSKGICSQCRQVLLQGGKSAHNPTVENVDDVQIVVSRTGAMYHGKCYEA